MIEEASFNGTVRIILLLLAIWVVVRWWVARQRATQRSSPPDGRKPGDVRIENVPQGRNGDGPQGRVVDADFEEIK